VDSQHIIPAVQCDGRSW